MSARFALLLAIAAGIAPAQTPAIAELEKELAMQRRLLNDWGGLTRYGSENAELPLSRGDRIIFLGDEITENWGQGGSTFFPGRPYLNRGIRGQATPQMLVRFRQDVIALKPAAVVIQGGLNDFAGAAGPATEGMIAENFMSMTELAKANGIRVVLASLTPVCDCVRDLTSRRPPGKIIGMNGWLRDYAVRSGVVYADYYAALVDNRAMKKDLTVDGLIPNGEGYRKMAAVAEQAITATLSRK